jgi:D-beta-D-heptose 7-phosphate kinase/D-beta-D-heptose 1-phosphate adenosyltransferase
VVITVEELPKVRKKHKDKSITLALGSFDIIHEGHIKYLLWAKQQADVLVVSLKSDDQISAHKGRGRPIFEAKDRVVVADALKPVDYALIGASGGLYDAAVATAKALHPDVVVLGPDWGASVGAAWEATFPGTSILIAPNQSEQSTTKVIERVQKVQSIS